MKPKFLEHIDGVLIHPTGSRYICDPPVMDTDEDWAIYLPNDQESKWAFDFLTRQLYNISSGEYENGSRFIAYRPLQVGWGAARRSMSIPKLIDGNENLIVFNNLENYQRFVNATQEAKRLNLLDKNDRVALFKLFETDSYIIDMDQDDSDTI